MAFFVNSFQVLLFQCVEYSKTTQIEDLEPLSSPLGGGLTTVLKGMYGRYLETLPSVREGLEKGRLRPETAAPHGSPPVRIA